MNRVTFTKTIVVLLDRMLDEGENPIGCDWWRSLQ